MVEKRQLFHRAAGDLPVTAEQGVANGHGASGSPGLGDFKNFANLLFVATQQCGECAPESLGAAGQEQILNRGVDGRATHHRDTVEASVIAMSLGLKQKKMTAGDSPKCAPR